ncbi:MAG: hypothetical protein HQL31_09390 [Planctomycetes bacterium]|nr:hypothetical protein [Planctomycetota bacterium]
MPPRKKNGGDPEFPAGKSEPVQVGLAEPYELMRQGSQGEPLARWGRGLFVQRGMAAWMAAFSGPQIAPPSRPSTTTPIDGTGPLPEAILPGVMPEVIYAMAEMVRVAYGA